MPILEYQCQGCENGFEWLSGVTYDESDPVCPTCGGKELQRKMSVFATATGGAGPSESCEPGGCESGPCGGGEGACGMGGGCSN